MTLTFLVFFMILDIDHGQDVYVLDPDIAPLYDIMADISLGVFFVLVVSFIVLLNRI